MSVCTFFGHSDCFNLDTYQLRAAIVDLIRQGADVFYVGNHGAFDGAVHCCLKALSREYPHIQYSVVLAYLPEKVREFEDFSDTVYPEGLELCPKKFAIEKRNRWMIDASQYCLCYVNHTWGGAYKFARLAKSRGLTVMNLGSAAF